MKKFTVEVTETLVREISIVAKDEEEALRQVKKLYKKEKIVLDCSDFLDLDFKISNKEQALCTKSI